MNETISIPAGSIEFLKVEVEADVNLDGVVKVAVCRDLTPAPTWRTAEWLGEPGTTRTACCLVDTADLETSSRYAVYVRISVGAEQPIVNAGTVVVTTR